ncbi:carbohydrate ABC transporter permease [Breznakiella homolactica]|uniref:sn-glycerol-3-phosphate transport system permease protein UgpE n=1 Tax=Breznakiella homolactica TaxID=2798577 RepID=A0A7T7XRH1_9SPIR|nr:carbohydrate ABC transporter permease [Breznakiella homolactica]QQO11156.1 carbohydrate ABC transporter permease [Breznakiella homolactica]
MIIVHKSKPRMVFDNLMYILLFFLIAAIFIFPMAYVVGNSFRDTQAIWSNAYPFSLKSFFTLKDFTMEGYLYSLGLTDKAQFQGVNIGRNLFISLMSSICVVASSLVFSTSAAYFFARLPFPGKKFLLVLVVATMMIPQQVVTVPLYFVANALGLINTFWALVVPWYSSPFVVFLLMQFLSDIPYELDEAAIVDGANRWQILWKLILPNCIPGLLTVCLMEFQFIWNEYFWPLIAISKTKLQPIQVAIASQFTDRAQNWGAVFASMVLASLPIILLFLFAQKYFYVSVASSGIKG